MHKVKYNFNQHSLNNVSPNTLFHSPQNPSEIIAKADSGASNHYWMIKDKKILLNLMHSLGPTVYLPNNTSIKSNEHGFLPLTTLSKRAQKAHILPGLKNSSLISLGQLCDDNCVIKLTKSHLFVFKNNQLVLTGIPNNSDGLWDLPLPQTTSTFLQH